MQTHRIAILVPLAVGAFAVLCTIMIHAFPLSATVEFFRREKKLGRVGTSFSKRLAAVHGELLNWAKNQGFFRVLLPRQDA